MAKRPKEKKSRSAKGKKLTPTEVRPKVNQILPEGMTIKAPVDEIQEERVQQIAGLLFFHEAETQEQKMARIARAIELFEDLKPADGLESMLALQMVGTHSAAMECLRRAALSSQTFAGRDMALKHAQKLMALYAKQVAVLDKHRGKGQQRVTVEHVNVAPGGQAIVGNVQTGSSSAAENPASLAHAPSLPLESEPTSATQSVSAPLPAAVERER